MPKKVYRKKRAVRRTKRAPRKSKKSRIGRAVGSPISDRFMCVLPYSDLTSISYISGGAPAYLQLRINSPYDPISGGHQAYGFDQYILFYNRYVVYGMSYKIHATATSATDTGELYTMARPDTTVPTSSNTILENPYTKRRTIPPYVTGSTSISGYCNVARVCGVPKSQVNTNSIYAALMTASPSQLPCLNVFLSNENTGANMTVRVRIDLKYYCMLYDRKNLAGS